MDDLLDIPALDEHAHNLLTVEAARNYPYSAAFTEGCDRTIVNYHARHTLYYRRSLRDIAQLLDCEPTEAAILERRMSLGLEEVSRFCFKAANLEAVILDDGFQPTEIYPVEWHQQFLPVYRLLRLEYLAEQLFNQTENFSDFLDEFIKNISPPPAGVVGFKSVAAYRTGLNIQQVTQEAAKLSFEALQQAKTSLPFRLEDKALIDFLVHRALEVAHQYHLPVQFHTGFGDPDLDLRLANPVYLRPILENKAYENAPIILLHASYPYMQEAGYLASVYPQVYLDTGLAVPMLSVKGMRDAVQQLLELAPTSKLMYSSDAHAIPELYYLGAKWGRRVLAEVLEQAIKDGDLTAKEAEKVAIAVLQENAKTLYHLEA